MSSARKRAAVHKAQMETRLDESAVTIEPPQDSTP